MSKADILVVEDDALVAISIKCTLEKLGYTVPSVVSSGEEALEKAKECKPDLVLMDIVLKGDMDGIETASQIGSCYNIPFIYLTAYADSDTKKRAEATGPCGYIVKPFKEKELAVAIEKALGKREQ